LNCQRGVERCARGVKSAFINHYFNQPMSKGVIIHSQEDEKGNCVKIHSVRYSGSIKTFVISDPHRQNVFCEKVWLDCVARTKQAGRDIVVIKWKNTGEKISAEVANFSLAAVLSIRPNRSIKEEFEDGFKTFENGYKKWEKEMGEMFNKMIVNSSVEKKSTRDL
jgi:hypothetical protein